MWADFYTPKAGMVFGHIEREAKRIRYWDMLVKGQVRMVRRRQGGGYFTILTPPRGRGRDPAGGVPLEVTSTRRSATRG